MRRSLNKCPPGLLVGLGLGVIVQWIGTVVGRSDAWGGSLIVVAGSIAGTWLAAAGARELARGLPRRQARGAQLAAIGFALFAIWRAWLIVVHLRGDAPGVSTDTMRLFGCGAATLASVGIAWAAGGLRRPVLAISTIVVGVLLVPIAPLVPVIEAIVPWPSVLAIYDLVGLFAWTVLILVAVTRAADEGASPPEQRADATGALAFAGQVLWVRVAVTSLAGMFVGFRIVSLINASIVGSTALGAATLLVFSIALVKVAAATGTGLARTRLHVGAFLALASGVIQAVQAAGMYRVIYGVDRAALDVGDRAVYAGANQSPLAAAFTGTMFVPLAGAVGVLLLVSAIGRLARAITDEPLRRAARSAATLYGVFMIASIVLRGQLDRVSTMTGMVIVVAFSGTFAVGAQVIVAALCGKAGGALANTPVMPTATVREVAS